MALTSQQSIQLYGTPAYTGWGETEASYDARSKGLTGNAGGVLSFDAEVDKAYSDLGSYYSQLLDDAQGDLNKALSRLQEDYDTGKRFRIQNFEMGGKAIAIAQEAFSQDARQAYKTLETRQLARGISNKSMYDPSGDRGIADVEQQNLGADISRGQRQIDLRKEAQQTSFDQTGALADIGLQRAKTDLPQEFDKYKTNLEEERRFKSGQLALSRQQRAFQRFEAGLV